MFATAIPDHLLPHHSTTMNFRVKSHRLIDGRSSLFPGPEEDRGRSAPSLSGDSLQNSVGSKPFRRGARTGSAAQLVQDPAKMMKLHEDR
jgi:hypothetical protein